MVDHVGSRSSLSMRLTVDCAIPARRASADCDKRARVHAVRIVSAAVGTERRQIKSLFLDIKVPYVYD